MWVKTITLFELQKLINLAIEKHGGDRKIKVYNYQSEELLRPQVIELQSDRGSWLEFL